MSLPISAAAFAPAPATGLPVSPTVPAPAMAAMTLQPLRGTVAVDAATQAAQLTLSQKMEEVGPWRG